MAEPLTWYAASAAEDLLFEGLVDALACIGDSNPRDAAIIGGVLDPRDRLIGRIDHPTATLDPPELQAILLHLARESDRLEYLLTGRDEQ